MYTTRFPQEAKRMQLKRQVVFESVDAGRIHEQVLELRYVVFAGRGGVTVPERRLRATVEALCCHVRAVLRIITVIGSRTRAWHVTTEFAPGSRVLGEFCLFASPITGCAANQRPAQDAR
ncbi:hypothetical protein VTN96DRAFT_9538 [Rasamsonia emersonii]